MRKLWNRIRFSLRKNRLDKELAEEIRLHRENLEREFSDEGLSAEEARLAASRRFGNTTAAAEQSRDEWSFVWLESVWQDLRYAARALFRAKLFAITAVLTLGIGLGLDATLFSLFNAYVLRPLAVREPNTLFRITWRASSGIWNFRYTWNEYRQLQERNDLFESLIAIDSTFVNFDGRNLSPSLVSPNFFEALGAGTLIGRPIAQGDSEVVVLSHEFWKANFGANKNILGRKLLLQGQPFEVIGVTRPEFTGLDALPSEIWAPLSAYRAFHGDSDLFGSAQPATIRIVARMKPGISPARVEAALGEFTRSTALRLGRDPATVRTVLQSSATAIPLTREILMVFSPVLAAFLLVLAACCVNVSTMMLARATARQREIGVRLSLGAARSRLIRQLLTESLLIAFLAGLTGLAIAQVCLNLGQKLFYYTVPAVLAREMRMHAITVDYRVSAFVLAAAAAATMLFGLAPALQATRAKLTDALRGEFGEDSARRGSATA